MLISRLSLQQSAALQFQFILLFNLLHVLIALIEKTPKKMAKILEDHDIVPDIVELPPKYELMLKYPYGYIPDFGNDLNPNDLEGPPFVVNFQREKDEYFTLLMIDPDQPSRSGPEESEWIHWMVTNIYGNSVLSGDTIVRYLTPKPKQYTGPHRYIFLVFKQEDGPMDFCDEKVINNTKYSGKIRGYFSTKEFVKRNHFHRPHAATFFYSEWKPPRPTTTDFDFDFTYDDDRVYRGIEIEDEDERPVLDVEVIRDEGTTTSAMKKLKSITKKPNSTTTVKPDKKKAH